MRGQTPNGTWGQTPTASRGLTLVELVIAMGLASIVMLSLSNLAAPLARAQILAQRAQTAQVESAFALSYADRAIRQAAWIGSPPAAVGTAERLEGCVNGVPGEDGLPPARIDAARPVRWFALCPRGGRLQRHEGDGCPPAYRCGEEAAGSFGVAASFTRPTAASTVVEISVEARSGDAVSRLRSAVGFSAAAGTNQ